MNLAVVYITPKENKIIIQKQNKMKRLILTLAVMTTIVSCNKEEIAPIEQPNCECNEVVDIDLITSVYVEQVDMVGHGGFYTTVNQCSGEQETLSFAVWDNEMISIGDCK